MTLSSTDVQHQLSIFEFAPGRKAGWGTLIKLLPDVETALFFARAYKMPYDKLSELLYGLFKSDVVKALKSGNHSTTLQDYIVDTVPTDVVRQAKPAWVPAPPPAQFLPQVWESIDLVIAESIAVVADKVGRVIDSLPSKQGQMVFQQLARMNRQGTQLGRFDARIKHRHQTKNLFILDDSGSMSAETIRAILPDVIASAWAVDATLALVSDTCRVWQPGSYSMDNVLAAGEFSGTHYETLVPLLNEDWGVVTTIADYDSSYGARDACAKATGRIDKVLDLSLVNRPTFLAACVGQRAASVEPILVAATPRVLN